MAVYRIELKLKPGFTDALGEATKKRVKEDLGIALDSVETVSVLTVDAEISEAEAKKFAGAIHDPVIQVYSLGKPLAADFDFVAEIGFKPGVTDNVGRTAKEAVEYVVGRKLGNREAVFTSTQYLFKGDLGKEQVERVCKDLLCNELIESWCVKSKEEWAPERGMDAKIPRVKEDYEIKVNEVDLDVSDEELMKISREGILALNLKEMQTIRDYFKKAGVVEERRKVGLSEKPTDVELETLAQTWSEHCKHKIFNALIHYNDGKEKKTINSLFKTYVVKSTEEISHSVDWLLSVFEDNAGVIKFNNDWNLVFKVETHNSPSALDPYGGALTGIVGVNRDPMGTGKGSRLIFNTDIFCFADPYWKGDLPPRIMHPKRVFEGVRKGVEHGGNKSGIPTVNGTIYFDDRYRGKPLVYCGTGGIMPREVNGEVSYEKDVKPNDQIVMVGGRIGKDGIHGATFSSEELHEGSPATAVQIGDPITQKKMADMLLEARDKGLYRCITDNGAGGLSSSVGETARLSGGCELNIEKAPLKYFGLQPWEILLSEAQERMTLAVPKNKIAELEQLCEKHGVELTVLGNYTDSGHFHVLYSGKTVAYIQMDFLHSGLPKLELDAEWKPAARKEEMFGEPKDLNQELKKVLSSLNICSKEYVVRQYDHEVQGTSVVKPLTGAFNDGPSDASVLKPLFDSWEGVVVSNGINPRLSDIDTYDMVANVVDEAIRNAVAVGASLDHLALLDNFCWCDPIYDAEKTPDGKHKLAQLVRACQALYDCTTGFCAPCISGKDSMKNDYKIGGTKISIPPTLLVSALGKIDDVRKAITMDAKKEGHLVYVLGKTFNEMGASEYLHLHGLLGNRAPKVNAEKARKLYAAVAKAIGKRLLESCHDVSNGGLAVALAETAFAGGLGLEADLSKAPHEGIERSDFLLFSESASRFVVTVAMENQKELEEIMFGNDFGLVGKVKQEKRLVLYGLKQGKAIDASVDELKQAWGKTLDW